MVWAFLECSTAGIALHGHFPGWLLSLSDIHERLLHLSWLASSFLFMDKQYPLAGVYHSFPIHLFAEWHVGCFQLATFMNKTIINTQTFMGLFLCEE